MIKAVIDTCSVTQCGQSQLTTAVLTYPRMIHSELLTHSAFARNAASSRAIPVSKFVKAVVDDPAGFEQYGAANKGMTAPLLMDEEDAIEFRYDWNKLSKTAVRFANKWKEKAAKQLVNRALEPWMHMTTVLTGDDRAWGNFFALRAEASADPTFQVLAYRALDAYLKAEPRQLGYGEWHIPMISDEDRKKLKHEDQLIRSVANCCRVSYTNHDKKHDIKDDRALYANVLKHGHMSPFAHQARASLFDGRYKRFVSYRETLKADVRSMSKRQLRTLLAKKPEWITLQG